MVLKSNWQTGESFTATDANAVAAQVNDRPALWAWDGAGSWSPPATAQPGDMVWNRLTGEVFSVVTV